MNRLASEPSPYLKQHAENAVDWYPWGPEALARAKAEDKPILLSVGYSACHWCHVMAHESFEHGPAAELMNQHFINVKVDREERPDIDQLYQGVVQLMGRGGGWPLTVFLTPDRKPFYGGTYFPPSPRHGLPGFPALLQAIADAWANERAELETQARTFETGLGEVAALGLHSTAAALTQADVVAAARATSRRFDATHGGFGSSGPKFPNPMSLALMLRGYRHSGERSLLEAVLFTLDKMSKGGIFDHLGGGFHRYSVDERWQVPHFEKMLYDNAQLIHLYAEAFQLDRRPSWQRVVERTVAYVEREMTSEAGALFSAQDADSEGEEGRFFVWRPEELDRVLEDGLDARLLKAHFGVSPRGNFEKGATVLHVALDEASLAREFDLSVDEVHRRLAAGSERLFAVRAKRMAPQRDDKVLAGWNGLMIRGLAFASRVFARPDWALMARRAADFVLASMRRPDGHLLRSYQGGAARIDGLLEDYGDLALGLVALHQATFEPRYLEAADELAELAHRRFWDDGQRAYLLAPKEQTDLLVPTYALHDNAFPSGASTLADAQIALTALTGRPEHLTRATTYLERMKESLVENPFAFGHLWLAADALTDGSPELTLVGSEEGLSPFTRLMQDTYLPTTSMHRLLTGATVPVIASKVLGGRRPRGEAAAYLCRHSTCQAPVATVEELRRLIGERAHW